MTVKSIGRLNLNTQDKSAEKKSWVIEEIDKHGYYDYYTEESYKKIFKTTIEYTNLRAGAKILEVGCGSSAFGSRLAKKGYSITGVDI